ncbi:MAG TPA: hypothetical protein VMV69_25030 [Pirellulales bacterium]|nr:hypothetical protein [Pirellulales bacterium]
MHYEPILIEPDDCGWIRFTRPRGYGGAHSRDSLEIRPGFTLEHVLAAVDATGWVVERNGERRIQDHIGCDRLARIVAEMLSYFDGPDEPNDVLRGVKEQIDSCFDAAHDGSGIPLWACAWLDLVLRDDVADAARSANTAWNADLLTIDVGKLRDERIRELRRRYPESPATPEVQRMADSARIRGGADARSRSAG